MFPVHTGNGVHTVRLADAISHMKATPGPWRDSLGQEKTVPSLKKWRRGQRNGGVQYRRHPWVSHTILGGKYDL